MLKQLVAFLPLFISLNLLGQDPIVPDTLAKRLKVKTATEMWGTDSANVISESYSPSGKMVKRFEPGGGLEHYDLFEFEYNDLGQLAKVNKGQKGDETHSDTIEATKTYTYNANGRIEQTAEDIGNGYLYTAKYIYFTCKNYVCGLEVTQYNKDGKIVDVESYKYDQKGDEIETDILGSNLRLAYKTTYTYNKKGLLIKKESRYTDGMLMDSKTYTYNDKNQQVSSLTKFYTLKGEFYSEYLIENHYNTQGLLIKEVCTSTTHVTTPDPEDIYPAATEETTEVYTHTYTYTFY